MLWVVAASASADERSLDGGGNNVAHPTWGQVGQPYSRVAPAAYADGVGKPLTGPPARRLSNRIFNDGAQNLFSENGVTQWGFVWGQFLDHTFGLREETGGEPGPIAFDAHDPLEAFRNDLGAIDFSRTPAAPGTGVAAVPRQQINTVSSYIDAWAVYGGTTQRLEWLREGPVNGDLSDNGAHLLLDPGGLLPRRSSRGTTATAPDMELQGRLAGTPGKAMVAGDVRANENVALTATQTLFAREHNRIVDALPPGLPEERKFQIARRVVGAEQQVITYEEFLPALGVELAPYRGYDPTVDATLSNEFATVGYRAHSQIHGELELEVAQGTYTAAQLADFVAQGLEVENPSPENPDEVLIAIPLNVAFFNPDLLVALGEGPML
ncbi:MAG TPA: peroxidase family protein, partial [Solirubrobacter sp.]